MLSHDVLIMTILPQAHGCDNFIPHAHRNIVGAELKSKNDCFERPCKSDLDYLFGGIDYRFDLNTLRYTLNDVLGLVILSLADRI